MNPLFDENTDADALFLGIDPGAKGSFVLLDNESGLMGEKMPETREGILTLLRGLTNIRRCVVEEVGGYQGGGARCPACKQARNFSPGSHMFNFGENYGAILMGLLACDIEAIPAAPVTWQRALGVPKRVKGEVRTEHKRVLKRFAQEMFPDAHITLETCDAILLAAYARRLYRGEA